MLTAEDRDLLGLAPEPRHAHRPSAVSQLLHAIRDETLGGKVAWDVNGTDERESEFRIRVACDRLTRQRAYALAHRVYRVCGYAPEPSAGRCVSPYDARPSTLTLLVEDSQGRDAATISLVFDSTDGLPCDEIYREELDQLRAKSRRLVEVTRLAISDEHAHSKALLVRLFNFIYIFSKRVRGSDDFVIEVNPRHVNYYRRLLQFEIEGTERPCPRVNGAPAVLLRLDLAIPEREVRRIGGQGASAGERTLYPYFYSWLEEGAVAEFLARQHRAMSEEEAGFFGLAPAPAPEVQPHAAAAGS